MTSLLTGLHFWTVRPLAGESGQLLSVHSYHDKGSDADDLAVELRRQWAEGRGLTWTPKNKRPEKLRDVLKDTEELLSAHRVIHVHWKSPATCQAFLQNGIVLHYGLTSYSGDIERVIIDRTLVGRLGGQSELLYDCAVSSNGSLIVFSFLDKPRIALVYLSQRKTFMPAGVISERLEKLSAHGDIRVNYIDLAPNNTATNSSSGTSAIGNAASTKRTERRLSLNKATDLLAVWWSVSAEDAWPWASVSKEKRTHASNLLLFTLTPKVELIWRTRTDSIPVGVQFSGRETYHLLTIEGGVPSAGDANACVVETSVYEFSSSHKVEKVLSRKVDLPGSLLVHALDHDESRLACVCSSGQLILHDSQRPKVLSRSLVMLQPSIIEWHPSDTVLLVASCKGDIQVFDLALSLVFIQLHSEASYQQEMLDAAAFLRGAPRLNMCSWSMPCSDTISAVTMETVVGPSSHQNLLLVFDKGPLCNICFELGVISRGILGPLQLMTEYITHHQIPAAVALLQHIDWNRQAKTAFIAMTMVVDHLLRMPLSAESEAFTEEALGSFLAPPRPLVPSVQMQYRNRINNLVRRFFHQLVRYRKFEKAFLLAEDICARDLFMDLHYLAVDGGEKTLAELAKHRAENVDTDEIDAASLGSLEAVEVDSEMSSSTHSRATSEIEVGENAAMVAMAAGTGGVTATGGDAGMQLELELSGSEGEYDDDIIDEDGDVMNDSMYEKEVGDDVGEALGSVEGLAESEQTLRAAAGANSMPNIRDRDVEKSMWGMAGVDGGAAVVSWHGRQQQVPQMTLTASELEGAGGDVSRQFRPGIGGSNPSPSYLRDESVLAKSASARSSARGSPASHPRSIGGGSRSTTPGFHAEATSPSGSSQQSSGRTGDGGSDSSSGQDLKVVNVGLV